jgi:hypothetical protein
MSNKIKKIEVPKNNEKQIQRRPKRCHLCKKSFPADKYVFGPRNRTNIFRLAIGLARRKRKSRRSLNRYGQWRKIELSMLLLLREKRNR